MRRNDVLIRPIVKRDGDCPYLPVLLTADEMAALLRTSRKAIYAKLERGELPGVVRDGRRVLFDLEVVLSWLRQKYAPSLREVRR